MNNLHAILVTSYQRFPPRSQRLLDWLLRRGVTVEVLCWDRRPRTKTSAVSWIGESGEPWTVLHHGGGENNWRLGFHYPAWAAAVARGIKSRSASVVVAFDLDAALGCAIAKREMGFRFVYDIADNFSLRHNFPVVVRQAIQRLERAVLAASDVVLLPDESRITPIERPYSEKIAIIYNCPSHKSAPPCDVPRSASAFFLSGYLTAGRGCLQVLDALSRVRGAQLVVAGHAPSAQLVSILTSYPQVDYRGQVNFSEAMLLSAQSAAVFTLYDPSVEINRRAASNKWFDSMMTATPVIANRELLAADWIQENDFGYLVPYDDPSKIAECMSRIISNPAEARAKGIAGRRLFESTYNWESMERRLEEVFQRTHILT